MNRQFLFLPAILVVALTFALILIANLASGTVFSKAASGAFVDQPILPSNQKSLAGANLSQAAVAQTTAFPGGSDELPPANPSAGLLAPELLSTPAPGQTLLYFTPTDNDATATVMFLYNTNTVTNTVVLRGYSYNGVLAYSLNISVNPASILRLSSDSIAAAPPPSWATPAPVITNFTDFVYIASLALPKGVKVEGYTVFNAGTGTVDPRLDQGAIPLRFSTDPATIFLPSIQTGP
jgi:hypothetical protein